jgi:hypothetical protein
VEYDLTAFFFGGWILFLFGSVVALVFWG